MAKYSDEKILKIWNKSFKGKESGRDVFGRIIKLNEYKEKVVVDEK